MSCRASLPVRRNVACLFSRQMRCAGKDLEFQLVASLAILGAALALTPNIFAQTGNPSEAAKTQVAAAPLSHDLSGVWMQYPEGTFREPPA